ncbi:MAG: stage II sporulation protein M [Calditrichaceae bacterium]|nr:stage II sporulation protein M [Calditrichaceae bacterium]RQV92013.1 MAG: stage II sporulation protein M [Calditrichota bacterium]
MIENILNILSIIHIKIFLISILFFIIGYAAAPTAYYKEIRFLTAYPLWVAKKMEAWAKKKWHPALLFLFLFSMNSISLLLNFFSGYVPGLPVIFAIWTGLNIGLITYHTLKGQYYFVSLANPVALFELPAAFISFTAAIQFNISYFFPDLFSLPQVSFSGYMTLYYFITLPLLVISGIIETILIIFSQKFEDFDDNNL